MLDDFWNVDGVGYYQGNGLVVTQLIQLNNTPFRGYTLSGRRIDEGSSKVQARERMVRNLVRYVKEIITKRQKALGRRKAKAPQCTKAERYLFHRCGRQDFLRNFSKCAKDVGIACGLCDAVKTQSWTRSAKKTKDVLSYVETL